MGMSMLRKIFFLLIMPVVCFSETVSVIVPCYYKHFGLLPELLKNISSQTELPDEVVISVSECEKIENKEREKITAATYPFKVRYLFHKEKKFAGENRNCACAKAKGDIFITQDSDDIPHPQRIEIIKEMFKQYDVVHVVHKFTYPYQRKGGDEWDMFSINKIKKCLVSSDYLQNWTVFGRVTNGEMAIRREVFDRIQWSKEQTGEDIDFNCQVVDRFHKSLIIDAALIVYRRHLSSNVSSSGRAHLRDRYIHAD